MDQRPITVIVCINDRTSQQSCATSGSLELIPLIEKALTENHLDVQVDQTVCFGRCNTGPNLRIAPGGKFFTEFSEEKIPELIVELKSLAL
jgi:NADH:ubiquinone oxidoreductase subunit E